MLGNIRRVCAHGLSETRPGITGWRWLLCLFLILSLFGVGFAQTPQTIKIVAVTKIADFQPGLTAGEPQFDLRQWIGRRTGHPHRYEVPAVE
jgi:hypothetical protein